MAIAKQLANDGFTIAFHSKASTDAGRALATAYPGASYTQADLSEEGQADRLVAEVLARHHQLDVLVNNAGISAVIPHGLLKAASGKIWRDTYEVNVIAPWMVIAASEAALRAASSIACPSCIINITSHAGVRPKGASVPYAASKAALNHVTRLLALSLSPDIRVNAIAPGLVDTPLTKSWAGAQAVWRERSPMRRGAQPEEVAHIASMLVSSTYLTGEIILCDGGLNLT